MRRSAFLPPDIPHPYVSKIRINIIRSYRSDERFQKIGSCMSVVIMAEFLATPPGYGLNNGSDEPQSSNLVQRTHFKLNPKYYFIQIIKTEGQ
jgi:hypothetical protein